MHDFREEKHDDPAPGHVSSSQQVLLSPSQPALHQSPQQLLPSSSSRNIRAQLNPLDISLSRVRGAFLDLAPVASSILDKARAGQTYIPIDTLMPRKRSTPSATSSGLAADEYESVFALSSSNHLVRVAKGERLTMSVARSMTEASFAQLGTSVKMQDRVPVAPRPWSDSQFGQSPCIWPQPMDRQNGGPTVGNHRRHRQWHWGTVAELSQPSRSATAASICSETLQLLLPISSSTVRHIFH